MNRFIACFSIAWAVAGGVLCAAPPPAVRIQGFVSDRSGGQPVPANGTFQMTFRLYDDAIGGNLVAASGPSPVQVTGGLYNVDVPFPPASFNGSSLFLEVQINSEILTPRIQVVSVPYAYVAAQATGVAPGGVTSASIAPGAVTPDKLAPCGDGQVLAHVDGSWTCIIPKQVCFPGDQISCYDGPPPVAGCAGPVNGKRTCGPGGTYGTTCEGQIPAQQPVPEICGDGIDNDCNGLVDENIVRHDGGFGIDYLDCAPLGVPGDPSTYTRNLAVKARALYFPSNQHTDSDVSCGGGDAVQRIVMGAGTCTIWTYSGPTAGYLRVTYSLTECNCPTTSDTPWY